MSLVTDLIFCLIFFEPLMLLQWVACRNEAPKLPGEGA